jgi:DNA repair exonuclease SbcCD ATPase subunit
VFVISHASSMHELFERQFTVVKEDGVSRLEIAR